MKTRSGRRNDRTAAKRPTDVSIRSDLLDAVREAGVNLSATLEHALKEENREGIAAYNEYVEEHGVFSDGVHLF